MTGNLDVNQQDLAGHDDLPDSIRESLLASGLPGSFARFELDFAVDALRVAEWASRRVLILGETDSGAIAVDFDDGAVWWLQGEILSPGELQSPAYRQFVNSSLAAFVQCVERCATLLQDLGPDSSGLEQVVRSVDEEALEADREGVWRDVVLDWDAGL